MMPRMLLRLVQGSASGGDPRRSMKPDKTVQRVPSLLFFRPGATAAMGGAALAPIVQREHD